MNAQKPPLSEEAKAKRMAALDKARKARRIRQAAARERGETLHTPTAIERSFADPKSKAKAILAYFWDYHGIEQNSGTGEGADTLRTQARIDAKRVVEIAGGRPKAIKNICLNCVNQVDSIDPLTGERNPGGDPGAYARVKGCDCTTCPLHRFRPFRGGKAAKSPLTPPSQEE